jgi:hypothetical protein
MILTCSRWHPPQPDYTHPYRWEYHHEYHFMGVGIIWKRRELSGLLISSGGGGYQLE